MQKRLKNLTVQYKIAITINTLWVVLTQFWVKYGQTQPLGYIFKLHF